MEEEKKNFWLCDGEGAKPIEVEDCKEEQKKK